MNRREPFHPDRPDRKNHEIALLLIAANVLVYLVMVAQGVSALDPSSHELIEWGTNYSPRVALGEWWRIPASIFVHAGLAHLAGNMIALYRIGPIADRLFGRIRALLMYFIAGVTGAVVSLYAHPFANSVGASGAIFGLMGAILGYILEQEDRRGVFNRLKYSLLLVVALSFIPSKDGNVDYACHIGGLAAGFLLGGILARNRANQFHRGFVLASCTMLIAAGFAFLCIPNRPDVIQALYESKILGDASAAAEQKFDRLAGDNSPDRIKRRIALIDSEILPPLRKIRTETDCLKFIDDHQIRAPIQRLRDAATAGIARYETTRLILGQTSQLLSYAIELREHPSAAQASTVAEAILDKPLEESLRQEESLQTTRQELVLTLHDRTWRGWTLSRGKEKSDSVLKELDRTIRWVDQWHDDLVRSAVAFEASSVQQWTERDLQKFLGLFRAQKMSEKSLDLALQFLEKSAYPRLVAVRRHAARIYLKVLAQPRKDGGDASLPGGQGNQLAHLDSGRSHAPAPASADDKPSQQPLARQPLPQQQLDDALENYQHLLALSQTLAVDTLVKERFGRLVQRLSERRIGRSQAAFYIQSGILSGLSVLPNQPLPVAVGEAAVGASRLSQMARLSEDPIYRAISRLRMARTDALELFATGLKHYDPRTLRQATDAWNSVDRDGVARQLAEEFARSIQATRAPVQLSGIGP